MEPREIKRKALVRFSSGALVLGAILFVSAGTIRYWQAWMYLAVIFLPAMMGLSHLIRNDIELLERRLETRESRKTQGAIQKLGSLLWLAVFLVPGLDSRFGWSSVPWFVAVLGAVVVLVSYMLFFLVIKENSYASRVVEVQQGQSVITTGPYALVRHPMYSAVLLMLLATPLALGSFWAMIPALFTPVFLVFRIRDEEAMLLQELHGYRDYTRQTRHRLIPGVW